MIVVFHRIFKDFQVVDVIAADDYDVSIGVFGEHLPVIRIKSGIIGVGTLFA